MPATEVADCLQINVQVHGQTLLTTQNKGQYGVYMLFLSPGPVRMVYTMFCTTVVDGICEALVKVTPFPWLFH